MTVIEEDVNVTIVIGGNTWLPVELEIERSRYGEVDTAVMTAIQNPDDNENATPDYDDEMYIDIGSTSDDSEIESTRVYTGYVSNRHDLGDGTWKIRCSNSILDIINESVYFSTDQEIYVSEAVNQVGRDLGIEVSLDLQQYEKYFSSSEGGYYRAFAEQADAKDVKVSFETVSQPAVDVLDKLAEASNSVWWVDRYDVLHFGPANVTVHNLGKPYNHVVNADAGKKTPPYKSVRVVGDGIASKEGWEGKRMLSENPVIAEKNLKVRSSGATPPEQRFIETPTGGLVEPTFVYKNKEIKTYQQAQNIRDKILNDLQEQQAGGWVEMVGRANLEVLDIVEMPEYFAVTNEGKRIPPAAYIVQKITHRLNNSDGFVTRVECGGLAGRYSGDVIEIEDLETEEYDESDATGRNEPNPENTRGLTR